MKTKAYNFCMKQAISTPNIPVKEKKTTPNNNHIKYTRRNSKVYYTADLLERTLRSLKYISLGCFGGGEAGHEPIWAVSKAV